MKNARCADIKIVQSSIITNHFTNLGKWEANHEELFISRIEQKHDQEERIGKVAKILPKNKINYTIFAISNLQDPRKYAKNY